MTPTRKYVKRKWRSNRIALDDKSRLNAQLYAIAVDKFFHGLRDTKNEEFRKLSKTEEQEMIRSLLPDRKNIEYELVKHNIFLAINIASKNAWRYKEYDTLISNAMYGLVEAAQKFDINRGTKFSTYATQWIRREILHPFFNDVYDKNITKRTSIFFDAREFNNEKSDGSDNYASFMSAVEPSVEFCYADIKNPYETLVSSEAAFDTNGMINNISVSIASSPLSTTDKNVYNMLFIDGKTPREVADRLSITTNAVSRSRGRIARYVFEKFGDCHARN